VLTLPNVVRSNPHCRCSPLWLPAGNAIAYHVPAPESGTYMNFTQAGAERFGELNHNVRNPT
jgi:hypothetical protein